MDAGGDLSVEPECDEPVPEAAAVAPATTEEAAPVTDEAEVIAGDNAELPEGWSEQTTEDGEKYYFNEHSGESSWERPPSNPGDNDVAAVDASIPVSETEYESAPTSDDGWQTVKEAPVSEDKGAPDDAETESLRALSTKQDIGSSPPPSVSELDGMMPGAMSQNAGDAETKKEENDEPRPEPEPAQDTGELPPGWLECTDPEGNTYYFNDLTGASSWERPQGGTTGDAPEPAETESAVDEAETESLRALSVKRDVGSSPPPSVSELDGMVEVPPTEGEELAVENEPSASTGADVGPEPEMPAEPVEAEVPGKEEVASLPEPWVELMTDAGEPYVSQVFLCVFASFGRSFLFNAPPTNLLLSSHLLSPIRSITTKRMVQHRGSDHRLLSRAQLALVTTLAVLLRKQQGLLATTLLPSRSLLVWMISLHRVKLSPIPSPSPCPVRLSSVLRPSQRIGRRKQPMLERYIITTLKRAQHSGIAPSQKMLQSKIRKLEALSPLTNLSTLRRSPK